MVTYQPALQNAQQEISALELFQADVEELANIIKQKQVVDYLKLVRHVHQTIIVIIMMANFVYLFKPLNFLRERILFS